MTDLMNFINNILWGSVLIYLLLGTGIYFTLRTGFIQVRHFGHMFSLLKNSNKSYRKEWQIYTPKMYVVMVFL